MKKALIIVTSIILSIAILFGVAAGGYSIFVNRKVDSSKEIDLASMTNVATNAAVTNNDKKEINSLNDKKKSSGKKVVKGDSFYFNFDNEVSINTIVIKESLNKLGSLAYPLEGGTKKFSIFAELNGNYELIYQNDKIDAYRMCSFDQVTSKSFKIQFDDCRGSAKIKEIEMYDVGKKKQNFRVNDYFVAVADKEYKNDPQFLSYLDSITDLTLFVGAYIDENGEMGYRDGKEAFVNQLNDIKEAVKGKDIKLYCNVFSNDVEASFFTNNSAKMAKTLADFTVEFDLEGVDMDWEYPAGKDDWAAYNQIVLDIRKEFDKVQKKLSLAVAVWNVNFSDEAKEAVDYFNVMIYDHVTDDYDRYHSTFKQTTLAIEKMIYQGYKKEKMCLGFPFYGREIGAESKAKNYLWTSYNTSNIDNKWENVSFDALNTDKNTGETSVKPAYFNGYAMIYDKTAYAIAMSLGGVMTWNMTDDMPGQNELSLHRAIATAIDERLEK